MQSGRNKEELKTFVLVEPASGGAGFWCKYLCASFVERGLCQEILLAAREQSYTTHECPFDAK